MRVTTTNKELSPWITSSGKVVVRPSSRYKLRKKRAVDENHTIVTAPSGLSDYYRWWIDRQLHLWIQPPMLAPHISVFNGKESLPDGADDVLNKYNGMEIEFQYNVHVEQHWKFWSLPVRSEALMKIRKECGVNPNYPFHITIGRML